MAQPVAFGKYSDRDWTRFLAGPDPELLENLYVPMLGSAVRYDRSCAYFSSSVLAAAARGFGKFIENLIALGENVAKPAIRLLVNEQMDADDVQALTETGDISKLEAVLLERLKTPKEMLEKKRLQMLAWLYKEGLLDIQVGIMRGAAGIVHAKFGIATDSEGECIVFNGSGNESAQGLAGNYEELEVSTKTGDAARYKYYSEKFELLWSRCHPAVAVYPLPEAVRLKLIKFAPKERPKEEPSNAMARQKAAMIWQFVLEAPYFADGAATCDASAMVSMWPHQKHVVEEASAAWPDGRLLCDEVGMGKTIEAILILRRLLAGRGVERVLILLPAGLLKQWQAELREKGGLIVPRLEGLTTLVWPDGTDETAESLAEALEQDLLLMSRETARTENNLPILLHAKPWDLVLLDEAHAARRKEQVEGEFNSATLLLNLLREMQLRERAKGILLLSATPMQTHPWEPWDLLAVLGEGGRWLSEFSVVRDFYDAIASVQNGFCDLKKAEKAAALIAGDPEFPQPPLDAESGISENDLKELIAFAPPTQRKDFAAWLRKGSPLSRRMHRNTRTTLRRYYEMGFLEKKPPERDVRDKRFDYKDPAERAVYDSVKSYIEKRFAELEAEKPGKGFVMTVYRRRASSSPQALERSLIRRRDGLLQVIHKHAIDPWLGSADIPELLDSDELPEDEGGKVSAALPQNPESAQKELDALRPLLEQLRELGQKDSKRDEFFHQLQLITDDGRSVLVFTEYADTMEYLRDSLKPFYNDEVACFSGDGGQMLIDGAWKSVSKTEITAALKSLAIRVLICTDAASEGLNLQAAGALINYDLPWNPSKVEQRIGRIDRIGQLREKVLVVNLFLENSVDERVYEVLRHRCGLFKQFVGAMQPVLARAKRMLRGEEPVDPHALEVEASQAEDDPLAAETYLESIASLGAETTAAYESDNLRRVLGSLAPETGITVKMHKQQDRCTLSGHGFSKIRFGLTTGALEEDPTLQPLTPNSEELRQLVKALTRAGENLPLVIGSHRQGTFRVASAFWLGVQGAVRIRSLPDLEEFLAGWDGKAPDPIVWRDCLLKAESEAAFVASVLMEQSTLKTERSKARQLEAARIRVTQELGRYLACAGANPWELPQAFFERMRQSQSTFGARLRECFNRLGGYPQWSSHFCNDLRDWIETLPEHRRNGRLAGMEVDAAMHDPRWIAVSPCKY